MHNDHADRIRIAGCGCRYDVLTKLITAYCADCARAEPRRLRRRQANELDDTSRAS